MDRRLLVRLHDHFSNIENPSDEEKSLLVQLTGELPYFPVTHLSREDLTSQGFDVSKVSDAEMEQLACKMGDSYCDNGYWDSLEVFASVMLNIPKLSADHCPMCRSEVPDFGMPIKRHICPVCRIDWSDDYALVKHPEDSSYFEQEEIGYPCHNCEDNGARYVPEYDYIRHFRRDPPSDSYFRPVMWPESHNYLGETSIDALCEPIEDEKGLAEFGSQAIWVPLCMLNGETPASKYDEVLDEVRTKFAAEIAEADANPDKWFEVFVADEIGSTHSEASGNTFDEAVENFERIADEWGIDKTSIDIWENRESPNNILQIK
jgi:hypothetical protein